MGQKKSRILACRNVVSFVEQMGRNDTYKISWNNGRGKQRGKMGLFFPSTHTWGRCYQALSCSLPVQLFLRAQSKPGKFLFSIWLILWSASSKQYGNGYTITREGGHRAEQNDGQEDHRKRELFKMTEQTKMVHTALVWSKLALSWSIYYPAFATEFLLALDKLHKNAVTMGTPTTDILF